jgi:hypothetical protein
MKNRENMIDGYFNEMLNSVGCQYVCYIWTKFANLIRESYISEISN